MAPHGRTLLWQSACASRDAGHNGEHDKPHVPPFVCVEHTQSYCEARADLLVSSSKPHFFEFPHYRVGMKLIILLHVDDKTRGLWLGSGGAHL